MDIDESVRIKIELISKHPIAIPLTKIANRDFLFMFFHKAFELVKFKYAVLEETFIDDRIVAVYKATFFVSLEL